jgi:hypothetical protein
VLGLRHMKRLLANLALAALLCTFVLPLAGVLQRAETPACCLPGGNHRCTQKPPVSGFNRATGSCPYLSHFLATSFAGLYLAKFEIAGPSIAKFIPTTFSCAVHRIAGPRLSNRGPPAS